MSAAVALALLTIPAASAEVLLDEKWSDGSRGESNRPKEAAIWTGRDADVRTKTGSLTLTTQPSSQKLWLYFTDKEPIKLKVGDRLVVSMSLIPRGTLTKGTSRGLRLGVFHDPTSPRVEQDINSDAGGDDAPWADAQGYAVQALTAGGPVVTAKPFDLGKRTNLESRSLLGTSGDYTKISGGEPIALKPDAEYSLVLEIGKVADKQIDLTASFNQDGKALSTWSTTDDEDYLGAEPICDMFDMLFIRVSNKESTADQLELTNIKVERNTNKAPATAK